MANPQKGNGFTPIASELLEAFIIHKFTEYQRVVVLFIWRKTYGWNKKEDYIANSQFVEGTGISKGHISNTLKELRELKVVICRGNQTSINKDWEQWKVTCRGNRSYVYRKQKLRVQEPQKTIDTNTKETHTKHVRDLSNLSRKTMKYINIESGQYEEEIKTKGKNKDTIALALLFDKRASGLVERPIHTPRSYFIVLNAMKNHSIGPKTVKKIFDDWFNQSKVKDSDKVKLSWCLSANNINSWKSQN